MLGAGTMLRLEGLDSRGDKPHLTEPQSFTEYHRCEEMAVMNRVE